MQIVFPSGLITDNRKLQGNELKVLAAAADKRNSSNGFAEVLRACWCATVDPGPYRFAKGGGAPDFKKICSGDLLKALLDHGAAVMGQELDFVAGCQNCGRPNELVVRVDELELKPLPESSAERIREGQPLETELLDGRKVLYDLGCINRDEYVRDQLKQMKRRPEWRDHVATFIDPLAGRIRSIEGLEGSNEFVKRLEHLLNMDVDWLYDLKSKMEEADCGVDTGVEFNCEHCGWEQEADFPLESDFFRPRKKRPKKTTTEMESETETGTSSSSATRAS